MKTIKIGDKLFEACATCGKKAEWTYMPGNFAFCDEHVHRGCSCNRHPIDGNYENLDSTNWKEETDELGRLLPCCEYWYNKEGWEINYDSKN